MSGWGERLPKGSRRPEPIEVAVDMLRSARGLNSEPHLSAVERAILDVYGRDVLEAARAELGESA